MERKLTQEQLRFIDQYLNKSGVRYSDIRFEMTDHVATALEDMEGDFHEDFRKYMVANKSELLASNRSFRKLAGTKAWGVIKKNFLSYHFWMVTAMLFACAKGFQFYTGKDTVSDNLHVALMLASTPIYFYFLYYNIFKRNVNSVIDKLLTFVYFGSIVFRLDKLVENYETLSLFYFSFSITFQLSLIWSLFQLNRKYKIA